MIMNDGNHSTDRTSGEYLLFAAAFVGFMTAGAGVVLASVFLALSGLCLLLFALACFGLASAE